MRPVGTVWDLGTQVSEVKHLENDNGEDASLAGATLGLS